MSRQTQPHLILNPSNNDGSVWHAAHHHHHHQTFQSINTPTPTHHGVVVSYCEQSSSQGTSAQHHQMNAASYQTPGNDYFSQSSESVSHKYRGNFGEPQTHSTTSGINKPRIQMNSCLVCNTPFTEKTDSVEEGLKRYHKLCRMLQVLPQEDFVLETNPLCPKCNEAIEEYLKLQLQIQGLMRMLGEMREMLGTRLVESYATTDTNRKNYQVKCKIYKVWSQRVKTIKVSDSQTSSLDLQNSFATIVNSLNDTSSQQPTSQSQVDSSYSLLDISNSISGSASVSNIGGSASSSVVGNHDSFDCPSPSSPGFQDNGSDDDYVTNLNYEGATSRPNTRQSKSQANNQQSSAQQEAMSLSFDPSIITPDNQIKGEDSFVSSLNEGANSENVASSIVNAIGVNTAASGLPTVMSEKSQMPPGFVNQNDEAVWNTDGRRVRPIIVTHRRTHPCKYCGKLFPSRFALEMHERVHTKEKPFPCSICGRPFANKAAMQKHELTHDKSRYDGEPQHECDICGKKYHLERSLYTHKREHMGIKRLKRRKPNPTPKPKWYKKKKYPKKKAPPKEKPPKPDRYECLVCPEIDGEKLSYKHLRALRKHQKRYHSGVERKVIRQRPKKLDEHGNRIPKEPKPQRQRQSATTRTRTRRSGPRRPRGGGPASCDYCGKTFPYRYGLEEHIRTHTGEKPFNCPKCEKCFGNKGNLDKHMKSHDPTRFDGEPSHICDFCGKGFYIVGTLYHHRRKHHLGFEEKYKQRNDRIKQPCECNICGRSFNNLSALSHHRVRHKEKKCNCSVCGKPFHSPYDANNHVKTHDPTWIYQLYFKHQCIGCPPEALGFRSKLVVREHWAKAHPDQRLPDIYRKPPKPKKPPGPGTYECKLCPPVDGKTPLYRQLRSLRKHERRYHSGSRKSWKPRRSGPSTNAGKRSRSDSEDEDEMSVSESGSESDNFDSGKEDVKVKAEFIEPVRRSARQTRGDTRKIAQLLMESEDESDTEDKKPAIPPSNKKGSAVKKKVGPSAGIKKTTTPSTATRTRATRTGNTSKLTDEYVNKVLGGKELRIVLTRVQSPHSVPEIHNMDTRNKKSLPPSISRKAQVQKKKCMPQTTRPLSRRVSKHPSRSNDRKQSEQEIGNIEEIVTTTLEEIPADTDDFVSTTLTGSCPDVKEEVPSSDSEDEIMSPIPIKITIQQKPPSKPAHTFPLIVHNPLAKSKVTAPVIIPTSVHSLQSDDPASGPKLTDLTTKCENATDEDEEEMVLGI